MRRVISLASNLTHNLIQRLNTLKEKTVFDLLNLFHVTDSNCISISWNAKNPVNYIN